ncbi:MAG: tRNA preQ1(34) S-adenosylmethionine ribosyltransferase-isomerase QueA [Parcubacteria group bacterium]|nr:tRNA preQ1(34) S-adenosylmethionine ribosyltransferase-isomerase QueA [Parcubacteria group bacterium]
MERSQLFFDLPQALIAQTPVEPRDACRLMVLDRGAQTMKHDVFYNLSDYLRPDDVLVFNQSKVIPGRLMASKSTGGKVEVLLLRNLGSGIWACLYGGKIKAGDGLAFEDGMTGRVLERAGEDSRIEFSLDGPAFMDFLNKHGQMPTPPYIKEVLKTPAAYQTIFAKEDGSAAAPTAGLHFTQNLLDQLAQKGIQQEFVTLHVGLGTFQPVKTERVEDHPIHSEWYSVDQKTLERLKQAKADGRRIVAVGTTSVRVLETVFGNQQTSGETNIFIYPGYQFKAVDALITNFHTPYSSLLALVYAFGGEAFIKTAYQQAIDQKYRFFSFGDAMLIQ